MEEDEVERELEESVKEIRLEKEWLESKMDQVFRLDSDDADEVQEKLYELRGIAEEQKAVLRDLRKGNNKEAFNRFEALIKRQKEFDFKDLYAFFEENNLADKEEIQKFETLRKQTDRLKEDILENVRYHAKTTEKTSYRPVIFFQKSVIDHIYSKIIEITLSKEKEFNGLLNYQRVENGLEIVSFDIESRKDPERSKKSGSFSDESKESIGNPGEQVLSFHTHPYIVGFDRKQAKEDHISLGTNLKPSSKDVYVHKNKEGEIEWSAGIAVIGHPSPEFMRPESKAGIFAISIQQHKKNMIITPGPIYRSK